MTRIDDIISYQFNKFHYKVASLMKLKLKLKKTLLAMKPLKIYEKSLHNIMYLSCIYCLTVTIFTSYWPIVVILASYWLIVVILASY